MFKKKTLAIMLAMLMMSLALVACSSKTEEKKEEPAKTEEKAEKTEEKAEVKAGAKKVSVFYYQYSDTYISTVRNAFSELVKADKTIELSEFDGQNDQAKQNDQIDTAIQKGTDLLVVNIVDTGAAQTVIDKAKAANVPVLFFNREPDNGNVYGTYDKAKFVGTKIEEAGILQGEIIAEYWKEGSHDRNGNGKLDYVLLHGGIENAEAVARSEYSVKTLKDKGIEVNEIAQQICAWDQEKALAAVQAWLAKDAANIDVVIANNDSMALGAITALQSAGINVVKDGKIDAANYVGVFGVDAIEEAQARMADKTMTGTVKQDANAMAKAIFTLTSNVVQGKDFVEGTDYKYDESGFAVRIPYVKYEVK